MSGKGEKKRIEDVIAGAVRVGPVAAGENGKPPRVSGGTKDTDYESRMKDLGKRYPTILARLAE